MGWGLCQEVPWYIWGMQINMGAPESCRTRPFGENFGHKTPPDPWKPPVEARLSQLPSESSFPIKIGFLCLVIRFLSSNQIKTFQNSKVEISAETGDGLKLPELITNHSTAYDFIKRKKRKRKKSGVSQRSRDSGAHCCHLLLLIQHRVSCAMGVPGLHPWPSLDE